jgi:cytochrome c oxidase cbb3-type subunit 3/ubiquinol-cytochrome c reductase cytochrome c subunit
VLVHQIKGTAYKIIGGSAKGTSIPTIVTDAAGISPAWGSPKPAPSDVPPYQSPEAVGRAAHPAARTSEDYEKIRTTIFARACSECHGDRGQGTEEAGAINKPEFLTLVSDQSLRRIIIAGRPDLGMPDYRGTDERASDFKLLNSAEIDDLVALLGQWRQGTLTGVK